MQNTESKLFLYFICCISAMGGLLFGYDWVVIGGAKPFYEQFFSIYDNPLLQGLATSTALVGCLVGAMVAGSLADKFGRKPLIITSAVLFTLSAVMTGAFNDFTMFNIARFIGGVGIGVASALSPMYIAEVSPANIRGRMVSLNQMTIVFGILAAQIANMLIAQDTGTTDQLVNIANGNWNNNMGWRWMFWAEAIPAGLFLVMSFMIPESPVFLAMKRESEDNCNNLKTQELKNSQTHELKNSKTQKLTNSPSPLSDLFTSKYRKILTLGLVIAVFQQWCGTNVIFNYAQEIFTSAGYDVNGMFIDIVITGIANVLFTFVALYTVEKWGRRTLMLIGAGGLGIIYLILGTCYHLGMTGILMVALVVAAISCYAMTLGPITWVLLAEIFPNKVRGIAMAVCTFALWTGCCTLTFSFPSMNAAIGCSGSFWIYSMICMCAFVFLFRNCPETKGKELE